MPITDPAERKAYQKRYHAKWEPGRHRKHVARLKKLLGGKCASCGSRRLLQFDHKNPKAKKFTITKYHLPDVVLLRELTKCQLLCKRCHLKKTKLEMGEYWTRRRKHGTWAMYQKGRCRCPACRLYKRNSRTDRDPAIKKLSKSF